MMPDPLTLLRMLCGLWLFPHCIFKIRDIEPVVQTFAKAGFHPPKVFVILTIMAELAAGVGLVTGIFPIAAAALAVLVLAGASYAVVKINGFNWFWQKRGPEYLIFWACACIASVSG